MYKLILFVALLVCTSASAQRLKPNSDCGFRCDIANVQPCTTPFLLYNDSAYNVDVSVEVTGYGPAFGLLQIYIDGIELGRASTGWFETIYVTIPLRRFHFEPGHYQLNFVFNNQEVECYGVRTTSRSIDIRENPYVGPHVHDTASQLDTNNAANEIRVYPVPARNNVLVTGLRTTETIRNVRITDMDGREMKFEEEDYGRSGFKVITRDFPAGNYVVTVNTNERETERKIQVVK